jgi:hypothetical protein
MEAALLDELRGLEAELHHPGTRCTRARLQALLHRDFHEVGRSGRPYDRETVITWLAAQTNSPPIEAWGHAGQVLAEHCALLTYRSAHRAANGTLSDPALRSSIWIRTAGTWQLLYHQGTPAASAG